MDDAIGRAIGVVDRAEEDMRGLIEEATKQRKYSDLPQLARLAEGLASLAAALRVRVEDGVSHSGRPLPKSDVKSEGAEREEAANLEKAIGLATCTDYPANGLYPRFFRDGDFLVKVGLSQKANSTYEHRAPWAAVREIVRRANDVSQRRGGRFEAESLSDIQHRTAQYRVPGYQLYLCLAWFKSERLVKQHGRKGYSILDAAEFEDRLQHAWENLPSL